MSSKLKNTKIDISKSKKLNENKKELLSLDFKNEIKSFLKPDFTIILLDFNNYSLIKNINNALKGECKIILYLSKIEGLSKARKTLDKKNIIVLYSNFEINNLKSHIADLVLCKDILVNNDNNSILIKEINRILKQKGYFIFFDSILSDIPFYTIKSFSKKRVEPKLKIVLSNFKRKLKNIKNSEYNIEIYGKSNFIYNSNSSSSLSDFYDFLINIYSKHKKIIFDEMNIFVKGERGI